MSRLFTDEHGDPIMEFPEDWNAMTGFLDDFENRARPEHEEGRMVTHAILDQFAHRYFPGPLHGLARALAVSTMHPTTWRVQGMPPPPAPVRALLLRTTGLLPRAQKALRPDPSENHQEQIEDLSGQGRRERAAAIRTLDEDFSAFFRKRHGLPARRLVPDATAVPPRQPSQADHCNPRHARGAAGPSPGRPLCRGRQCSPGRGERCLPRR